MGFVLRKPDFVACRPASTSTQSDHWLCYFALSVKYKSSIRISYDKVYIKFGFITGYHSNEFEAHSILKKIKQNADIGMQHTENED